jgi:glycine oxidase
MTDCIVIGAGLIGMLTAQELAGAGLKVTVLEKAQPGGESSWAGGGILSPLYPWRYGDAVNVLAQESQRAYPAFCQRLFDDTGIDPQWTQSGLLIADIDDASAVERWAARFSDELDWTTAEQARGLEPELGIAPDSSVWLPGIAQVRNPRLMQSLQMWVQQQGVEIRPDCPVLGWKIRGRQVVSVATPQGELSAGHYVVASGAWSGELLAATGMRLPVEPVRGQMILFKGPPGLLGPVTLYQGHYAIPRRDGRVLFGSTLEYAGFDKRTTPDAREELLKAARELLPCLADLPVEKHWAGLRPGSRGGIPAVGPHPGIDNLYVNAGHFRNGVVLGLASCRLLSDLLLKRWSALDASPYLPEVLME